MKRVALLTGIFISGVSLLIMAYSSGPNAGNAGDPPGNAHCGNCHTSYTVNSGPDSLIFIITNANGDTIDSIASQTSYTLHVTVQGGLFSMGKAGFQLIPLNTNELNGPSVGTFSTSMGVQTKTLPGRVYVTHTSSSNTPSGNQKTWQVNWTSPASLTEDIRFYSATVAGNGNGQNSGDYVRVKNFTYTYTGPCHLMNQSFTICQGDSIQVGNHWYSSTGTYYDTLTDQNGCDSVVVTQLTVNIADTTYDTATICSGDSIMFAGQWLYMAGTYYDTQTNMYGCDSIILFSLYVHPDAVIHDTAYLCNGDSVWFRGQWIMSLGVYRDTAYGANSCDSIFLFHVMAAPPIVHPMSVSICDGETYDFFGTPLTQAGTYYDTVQSTQGCDTIHMLTLSVIKVRTAINIYRDTIFSLASNAQYQWVMCDTGGGYTAITGATMSYYVPKQAGAYAVIITQNGCTDTSACIPWAPTGMGSPPQSPVFTAYPNPTTGPIFIHIDPAMGAQQIEVIDLTGKLIMQRPLNGQTQITLPVHHLSKGLYYLTVSGQHSTHTIPIIKE